MKIIVCRLCVKTESLLGRLLSAEVAYLEMKQCGTCSQSQ